MTRLSSDLPQFLHDLIASPPRAGEGVHGWIFRVARQLHAHRSEEDIFWLLKASLDGCGRHVPDRELIEAVHHSKDCAWQPNYGGSGYVSHPAKSIWPDRNKLQIDEIVQGGFGLYDLWETSPVRYETQSEPPTDQEDFDGELSRTGDPAWITSTVTVEGLGPFTEEIIDHLFPGNPLLCVGKSAYTFGTRRREVWRGRLSNCQFIVPSPMARVKGTTTDGKQSEHCLDNTGPRRFLVVEFDFSVKARDGVTDSEWAPMVLAWEADGVSVADACAALLANLAERAPLVLAVHSAGKSVHGWFYCAGQAEPTLRQFMEYAHIIGADPATWCKSQFVRMPEGTRDNGKRQTVYFFNPDAIGTQI
jgi:hypothetical protein